MLVIGYGDIFEEEMINGASYIKLCPFMDLSSCELEFSWGKKCIISKMHNALGSFTKAAADRTLLCPLMDKVDNFVLA